jgi:acyl-CoA synthetase (NDP forming)
MIREIRGYGLLAGQRGEPPYDVAAVADLLVKFSRLPFSYPEVGEIDLNPVFVLHAGVVVGDVRVIRIKQEVENEKVDQ